MRLLFLALLMCLPMNVMAQNDLKGDLRRAADEPSVIEYLKQSENHTLFVNALTVTGYDLELDKNQSWTVFAPTNGAFAKLPRAQVYGMFRDENRDYLKRFVAHHIQKNGLLITKSMPVGASRFTVLNGQEIVISKSSSGITVNHAYIFQPDIRTRNGVVHFVDGILLQK